MAPLSDFGPGLETDSEIGNKMTEYGPELQSYQHLCMVVDSLEFDGLELDWRYAWRFLYNLSLK